MPTILTYFDDPGFHDYPFDDPHYVNCYHRLAAEVQARGGDFWIVRSPESYKGNMRFTGGWHFVHGTFERVDAPVKGDLIYVKGRQLRTGSRDRLLNPAGLDAACGMDKQRTYEIFPEHFPATVEVATAEDLPSALERLHTDTIVLKPVAGYGGTGVFIGTPAEARSRAHTFPLIAQEFVDTSAGIPGITPSHHDYRVLIMGGRTFMTFVRTPPQGALIANVARGGTMRVVQPELHPASVDEVVAAIDEKVALFEHRLYTIDLGRSTTGKWYVFELNDQPGLLTPEESGPYTDMFYGGLTEYLLSCAEA